MPAESRIVVTGIGLVTACGADRETSWRGILHGTGAAQWLDAPDPECGGSGVLAGAPAAHFSENPANTPHDPVVGLALRAAAEALADGDFEFADRNLERIGCVIGTSKGGLRSFASAWRAWRRSDSRYASPYRAPSGDGELWSEFQPDAAARFVARRYDLRGAALCPVAACATGLASLARGADLIAHGTCDAVLAGSSDASLTMLVQGSFRRLGVLAHGFDDPRTACRPFDRRRNGFLIGEGAAVLLLEREDLALARGVVPYAIWLAGATASDPAHLTQMESDARSLTWLVGQVLKQGSVSPDEIDYVNLHGTATRQNDISETRALQAALGKGVSRISASSLKGTIGHLLGGAGSVELAATLLAMRDGLVPPTANLTQPDPECDLDCTPVKARPRRIETALKLSLGFGGHLAAAVVRAWDGDRQRAAMTPSLRGSE